MEYALLGSLAARVDGRELPLGGPKQRALLALLLVHANELVPAERIVDELWPPAERPVTGVKTVQVHVSQLRKLLGDDAIETHGPGYVLRLGPDDLDVRRFERLVGEGRRLLGSDPAAAAAAAGEALSLWRGPPLADVAQLPFAHGEIERLEELRLVALEQRLEAELALGRHAQAVPELERLAADHPLRENVRGLLMLALYRSGRQADALAAYRGLRRVLRDELGLDPGQPLQHLEQAILLQDPALDPPPPPAAPAAAPAPPPARPAESGACPVCGAVNAAGARFCTACGTALGVEQPIELRKTVTVLFCDVVASTELGERLDPEPLRRLMSRFYDESAAVLARHGGTVEKFVGDEVMAVFGVPAVRQDDALRAVRAAVELRDSIPGLRVPEWDGRLEVRIGVNTGEVVAGDPSAGHGFVTGDAVNVGKRLEQAARPGELLIGAETYALVAHAVDAEPLEPLTLKGKRATVPGYRLLAVDAAAPALPVRDVRLVARDAELDRLCAIFRDVASNRRARLVTVVGEPGIGKSRLVRELVQEVEHEAVLLVVRCTQQTQAQTFGPLAAALPELAAAGSSLETFAAARRLLEERTRERPVLLVLEDAHWAEPGLLDLVEYVVGALTGAPFLVVAIARTDLGDIRPQWLRDALVLEPLDADGVGELLEVLGAPAQVRMRIGELSEGNPLFVEQLAAIASDEAAAGSLPASIRGVLAERLDRLGREERAVLERAAVVGREFSLETVVALSPPRLQAHAPARLLALARRELLAPAGASGFRFRHALIRDAAYDGMPKVLRAELHERHAAELAAAGADEALVGYHLEQAYRHRDELGRLDGSTVDLGTRAGRTLARAGRSAFDRSDFAAATSLIERAVALLPAADDERAPLLVELGSALMKTGDFVRAEQVLSEARETARRAGDRRSELRALLEQQFRRSFAEREDDVAENARVAGELIPELEAVGDDLGLAKAWWLYSESDVIACRWQARGEALERALGYARRTEHARDLTSTLTALLAQALCYGPTPVPAAIARCETLLEGSGGDRPLRAALGSTLAALHAMQGSTDLARRLYADSIAIYEDLGLRFRRSARALVGAQIELAAAEPAAAVEALRVAVAELTAMGESGVRSVLEATLADLLCGLGRFEEAKEIAVRLETSAGAADVVPQVLRRSVLARLCSRAGDHERAAGLIAESRRLLEGADFPQLQASVLVAGADVAAAAGRADEARRALLDARALYEAKGDVVSAQRLAERHFPAPDGPNRVAAGSSRKEE